MVLIVLVDRKKLKREEVKAIAAAKAIVTIVIFEVKTLSY